MCEFLRVKTLEPLQIYSENRNYIEIDKNKIRILQVLRRTTTGTG